uniref:Uncharacterized protein n=1 Tax=Timema genevievae TaxID=629358 RepID=A0A7R9PQE5_TIMGE|nr:unnamed protein product [Timema genevievae]
MEREIGGRELPRSMTSRTSSIFQGHDLFLSRHLEPTNWRQILIHWICCCWPNDVLKPYIIVAAFRSAASEDVAVFTAILNVRSGSARRRCMDDLPLKLLTSLALSAVDVQTEEFINFMFMQSATLNVLKHNLLKPIRNAENTAEE